MPNTRGSKKLVDNKSTKVGKVTKCTPAKTAKAVTRKGSKVLSEITQPDNNEPDETAYERLYRIVHGNRK